MLETYRECLQDVFDLPALKRLLRTCGPARSTSSTSRRPSASPYSSSLLFDYIATYMYEDDTPPAERRAQALSLDRDLLRELLGQEELRDLLDPGRDRPRSSPQLAGGPERSGRAARPAPAPRRPAAGRVRRGVRRRARGGAARAVRPCVAGEERLIAAEDAGRYRDALGAMPPSGLPDAFLEADGGAARALARALRAAAARSRPARRPSGSASTSSAPRSRAGRSSARTGSSAASCGRAAPSASGATPTSSGGSGAPRSPRSARRSSRSSRPPRPLPAGLAGNRPRATLREALVPLQGLAAAGRALGVRGAAAARAELPAGAARPALRDRGGRLGRRRARPRRRLLPGGRAVLGRPRRRSARGRGARPDPGRARSGAEFWFDLLDATGLEPRRRCPRSGSSSGPARSRTTRGRRSAPAAATACRSRSGAAAPLLAPRGRPRSRPPRDGGRSPAGCSRASGTGARSPSSCSSGRASSPATASAPRESPAATPPSTASCRRSRRSASAAAATSSRASAAPSSRSAGAVERLRELRAEEDDGAARPRRGRPGAAVRRGAPLAEAGGRARGPGRRRVRRPDRRRGGALRRARRPDARPAPRAGRGVAPPGARGARRAREERRGRSGWPSSGSTARP